MDSPFFQGLDPTKILSDYGLGVLIVLGGLVFLWRELWPFTKQQFLRFQEMQDLERKRVLDVQEKLLASNLAQHNDFIAALATRDKLLDTQMKVQAEQSRSLQAITETLASIHELQMKGKRERDRL